MYVNILGNVKNPGTHIIYQDADILTILSQAGGPLPGSKTNKIIIYKNNAQNQLINLDELLSNADYKKVQIHPNDTIYVEQTMISFILSKSNIINSLLQMLNIYISITR